ncbi:MAG: DUF1232 domain-containing protein [Candidatus Marinimicrobia bacterium]|mgnify:CR=1 FL=1|jgi:hypothetical protein|nr:DUF1232 domain-containing protein [Candidatus Neomarinimicrobiota bacterium]|tara:strand:+ start:2801 stop:3187 length:387 start_codon:yes stop_codon:yes gene_type:complete
MNDPKLFQITAEDKAHYHELIEKIDIENKDSIIKFLGIKIQSMLDDGKLNSVETELIEDMTKLVKILELYNDLPDLVIKKVLFAMSYFIDENDEIPDIIPDYGYLDDITVVSWIMVDIQGQVPAMPRA